ncbi:Holliday junction resolvase RecU [Caldibacillus lycopersici]|uniref:Holliday junction resolvase RecU n=1 Tax=Perspicuibacillus lycopersici TaxID=1325689 RepID=A0AAE3LN86_9BACI|nr:Holliday junction resolvase RecU [Perspicuibacillus lycopersici]MCU9613676.1 Holliday junction resolvase RecU [Perspicuibacillus lycopersici]
MEIRYPNGKKYNLTKVEKKTQLHYGNRGMTLEEDLNESNDYYLTNHIAVIHKKPTPVQIVSVDYPSRSAAVIKEAYFKTPSTTDYNGVYKGKYIDFEAKETKNPTSLPLSNFHEHQVNHIRQVLQCGGISFVIIRFSKTEEVYLLDGNFLLQFWERMEKGGRKSITKQEIIDNGHNIPLGINPRIDYIRVIDSLYKEVLD